tara:strand:+ start:996 stop:1316 length:321 start_codon:yes stop_codon:yes gene_type:complete
MTPELGTISHGTMRLPDVIPCFLAALWSIDPQRHDALIAAQPSGTRARMQRPHILDSDPWWRSDDADELLVDLFDALDGVAPEGTYFGAHEGDGSDYGFWPIEEEE